MFEIGSYLITPLTLLLISTGIVGLLICLYLFQYRKNPGVLYLSFLQFFTALWALFYALEFSATTIELKLFWSKFSYLGIAFTPVSFLLFALSFSSKENLLTKQLKAILVIIPLIFIAIVFTNDWHHLHWISAKINPEHNTTIYTYGISFWMLFIFTYSLLLISVVNIMQLLLRFPEYFQSQLVILVLACFLPVAGNVMYLFNVNPVAGFDWTPVFFLFSGILLAYINIRYGIFNLVPFARNKLIDIMQDAVIVVDKLGRIADVNPAFLNITGEDSKHILGKKLSEAFPKMKSLIDQLASNRDIEQLEVSSELNNQKYSFDIRISCLYDKRKLYSGRLVVFRDITERSRNEQETKIANQRLLSEISEKERLIADLDAFAHTVAHDLKNMIGAIVTCTDMMEMEIEHKNEEGMREINELIQLSANKTLHVTKELLTLASVRQQDVKCTEVDMASVVTESIKRLKDMIESNDVLIKTPKSWPTALGYAPWIEEVWVNYISNAIKYGGNPPILEMGADQLPLQRQVRFWIKDNGKGLSKEEQKQLFLKFSRLDPSRAEGNGLGLSIVKRIIEKLGGEVGVLSNAVNGEGSLFYFVLPSSIE
ncbi:histidine kinase N-terminal 7TM domain-containing protein [Sunxiuqinia sp. A32]|uniref:histidine kinase N-terminal 7TM domain-containing protein n=1 Tax=Sunxiuqinia sp. A32 TaxID=3461496 RepID=UPI0040458BDD